MVLNYLLLSAFGKNYITYDSKKIKRTLILKFESRPLVKQMENWKVFLILSFTTGAIFYSMRDLAKRTHISQVLSSMEYDSENRTEKQQEVSSIGVYNATAEVQKRRENLRKWCKANGKQSVSFVTHLFRLSSLNKYISKFGVSIGEQAFWACFTPKCASQ